MQEGPGNSENLRTTKIRMKIFPPVRFPAQNQVKTKKKGLHSDLVRFLAQNWVKAKKKGFRSPFVCSNLLPKLQRGVMPQFCELFYANYTILATQRGAMAQWPPPKYAPDN